MNALRELCAHPEHVAIDAQGHTVVRVDRVLLAATWIEGQMDALVREVAKLTGTTPAVVRNRFGLNHGRQL